MNAIEQYIHDRDEQVRKNLTDRDLAIDIHRLTESLVRTNYVKNYTWRGVPTLQYPTDLMVMQELIWKLRPDYIIETGIAFGGMTSFYSDMQSQHRGEVVSIDIDIRPHAEAVLAELDSVFQIESSSTDPTVPELVRDFVINDAGAVVLVTLDSNHTHDHVLEELRLYSPLVSVGSYIVVFDTAIEFYGHLDKNQDRPWGKGNNPWTAVQEFMKNNDEFVVDREIEQRAVVTSAPGGFLRRVK
jgi:cephalosporin hydroxylase